MSQPRSTPEGIRSGINKTGATIGAGLMVMLDGTNADGVKLPASIDSVQYGVTLHDIAVNAVGDVQIRGMAVGVAGDTITMGARLGMSDAGKLIPVASGKAFVGIAKQAAADKDLFEFELTGPGTRNVA